MVITARLDRPITINTNFSNQFSLSVAGLFFPEEISKNGRFVIIIYRNGDYSVYKVDQNNRPTLLCCLVLDTPNGIENCLWSHQHKLLVRFS